MAHSPSPTSPPPSIADNTEEVSDHIESAGLSRLIESFEDRLLVLTIEYQTKLITELEYQVQRQKLRKELTVDLVREYVVFTSKGVSFYDRLIFDALKQQLDATQGLSLAKARISKEIESANSTSRELVATPTFHVLENAVDLSNEIGLLKRLYESQGLVEEGQQVIAALISSKFTPKNTTRSSEPKITRESVLQSIQQSLTKPST